MLDSFSIFEELVKTFDEKSAKVLTKTLTKIYNEIANVVTKEEFNELKEIVSQLVEVQKKTEERIDNLSEKIDKLTERVEQLAEAQRKTEEIVKGLLKDMNNVKERKKD